MDALRTHIGFPVQDLDASLALYRTPPDAEPARVIGRYAQFLLDAPGSTSP